MALADPRTQHRINLILAWAWLAFGIYGLVDYLIPQSLGIAKSIPILFFISVYANFVGHISAALVDKAEVNADDSTEDIG